jgi:integrase
MKKGKIEDGSWSWYEQKVRLYLKPVVGTIRLEDLSSLIIERFMNDMATGGGTLKKPVSVYGQRAALTTLRAALGDAVRYRLIDSNPTQPVKKPKKTHRVAKWWSAEEATKFLESAAVIRHRLFALFRLALDSGMRLGELFALKWTDFDMKARTVHVCRALEEVNGVFKEKGPKTKAGDRRLILSPETIDALAEHRKAMLAEGRDVKEGTVFVNEVGEWIDKPNFYKLFLRLAKRAAVPKIRPYDMRHSAASMWLTNGASIVAVAARLGHEDPAMTLRHYAHCLPSEQGTIANMASRLLSSKARSA